MRFIVALFMMIGACFAADRPVVLVMMEGQSNMAGHIPYADGEKPQPAPANLFLYNGEDGAIGQFGPVEARLFSVGYSTLLELSGRFPQSDVIGFYNAQGSTGFGSADGTSPLPGQNQWRVGDPLHERGLVYARSAIPAVLARFGTITLFIHVWHQGENDAGRSEDAADYATNYMAHISDYRTRLGIGDFPTVLGSISDDFAKQNPGANKINRQIIIDIPAKLKNSACADLVGLATVDGAHFAATELNTTVVGSRVFKALSKLKPAPKIVTWPGIDP